MTLTRALFTPFSFTAPLTLLLILLLPVATTTASAADIFAGNTSLSPAFGSEFLPVNQAFVLTDTPAKGGLRLTWKITPGHYLYKERMAFSVTGSNASLGEPEFSIEGERKNDPHFGKVTVFHSDVSVFLPVYFNSGTEATIKARYQGCADAGLCYPPQIRSLLILNESASAATAGLTPARVTGMTSGGHAAGTGDKLTELASLDSANSITQFLQSASLIMIAGLFFLLGIGLTFTPCVFPMIPIVSSIIVGQTNPTVIRSSLLSLSYVLGMAITYSLAGVATGLLGAGANAQAILQSEPTLIGFAVLFSILALAMFGVYELQLPTGLRDKLTATSNKLSGGQLGAVFGIGATSALIVSPCVSAPLAGSLVYISTTEDALIGGIALFMLGLGMGVPLIAVAIGGGKLLPKAGAWMDTIKQVFGFLLLGVAIWLLSRLLSDFVVMLSWAFLIGTMAVVLGALEAAETAPQRVVKAIALFLFIYAIMLIIGAFSQASDPLNPLSGVTAGDNRPAVSEQSDFVTITSSKELTLQLQQSTRSGKLTLVDFYADWCVSCKEIQKKIFAAPDIRQTLANFHLIKADVTRNSPENIALLKQFDLFGPPALLFFDKNGSEIKTMRIQGDISKVAFLHILNTMLGSDG